MGQFSKPVQKTTQLGKKTRFLLVEVLLYCLQLVAKLTPGRGTWERHLREAPWRGTWVRHVGVRHLGEAPGRGTWERHLGEAPGRGHVWLSVQRHANSLNDRQTTHQTDYLAACHIVHPYRLKSEAQLGPSLKIPKSVPWHTFKPPGLSNLKNHKSGGGAAGSLRGASTALKVLKTAAESLELQS